jgi:hypothetical protein
MDEIDFHIPANIISHFRNATSEPASEGEEGRYECRRGVDITIGRKIVP